MKKINATVLVGTLTFVLLLTILGGCAQKVKAIPLGVTEIGKIESISYKDRSGTGTFLFSETWYWENNPSFLVDQEEALETINLLENITVVEQLAEITSLVDYGLQRPDYTLTLTDENGISETVFIGDETEEDHFYATDEKKETVYIIDGKIEDALEFLEEDLVQIKLMDTITSPTR